MNWNCRKLIASAALAVSLMATPSVFAESQPATPKVFVWIEIEAAPERIDETREMFHTTIKTYPKPGMLSAVVFEDTQRPGVFHSMQEWEDEAAFQEHMSEADGQEGGLEHATRTLKGPPKLSILKQLD
ncbi:putative quinol monooxygenase [Aurantimonas endophytica]|uniref:Quinol monooxygenase YgiN n=1 Tax=Aurantimonas endophytica TaxID=1522175 RepID=A0A7W6HFN9_9HYPH|nr:antibiotic biosynthesis monooxygenase [Aurantimonas endophytica]MBB4004252.1 quinol monooxygenase YgiN [Aurantimonas endophytica]MCO6405093.1 antibiotic biosynthesis monooxygenase [Aurantimonas endophytica]